MEKASLKKLEENLETLSKEMLDLDEIRSEVAENGKHGMAQWLHNVEKQEREVEELWNELDDLEKSSNTSNWKIRLLDRRVVKCIKAMKVLRESGNPTPNSVTTFLQNVVQEQLKEFSLDDLYLWTSKFSSKNKIGFGGYGDVYKGSFSNGKEIAVKVLAEVDVKEEVFIAEVRTMAGARHVNLIKLLGFCFDCDMKALVYEYMENGSLDKVLYDDHLNVKWSKLYYIAIETAKALAYLHEGTELRIIHHDIKAANVLLDRNLSPKITDFGLAKLSNRDVSHVTLSRANRGTKGYMAPEIQYPFEPVTEKCDVYSFGMMLFEILGKRNNTKEGKWFPKQVWQMFDEKRLDEILMECNIVENDRENATVLIRVALWCVQFTPAIRPTMSNVVKMLEKQIIVTVPKNPFLHSIDPSLRSSLKVEYLDAYQSLPEERLEIKDEDSKHEQLSKSLPLESTPESSPKAVDENHQNLVSSLDHDALTQDDFSATKSPVKPALDNEAYSDAILSVDESLPDQGFAHVEENLMQEHTFKSLSFQLPVKSDPVEVMKHSDNFASSSSTSAPTQKEVTKHSQNVSPPQKARSSNTREFTQLLMSFEEKFTPSDEEPVILYTTTMGGVMKTFYECNDIRLILEVHQVKVSERDLWLHDPYKKELKEILGRVLVPALFVKGRFIGGAKVVKELQEEGLLRILFDGISQG